MRPFEDLEARVELLEDTVGELQEDLEEELYSPGPSARQLFEKELEEVREWRKNSPNLWKTLFKQKVDDHAVAFYFLDEDVQRKLVN